MDLKKLSEPLTVEQIEFRIQSVNGYGKAIILPYKDARVDINRLNDVCGGLWARSHSRDNKNCAISIYNKDISEWVSREDTGTESNADAQKGLASDSFKRAGTNWGIGIELYSYPVISLKLNGGGNKNDSGIEYFLNASKKDRWGNPKAETGWGFKLKEWKWKSEFTDGKISFLAAQDQNQKRRFTWGEMKPKGENK